MAKEGEIALREREFEEDVFAFEEQRLALAQRESRLQEQIEELNKSRETFEKETQEKINELAARESEMQVRLEGVEMERELLQQEALHQDPDMKAQIREYVAKGAEFDQRRRALEDQEKRTQLKIDELRGREEDVKMRMEDLRNQIAEFEETRETLEEQQIETQRRIDELAALKTNSGNAPVHSEEPAPRICLVRSVSLEGIEPVSVTLDIEPAVTEDVEPVDVESHARPAGSLAYQAINVATKKKKYRLRGRSSETAKAHRG
eukprot:TRINITY_DN2270_c0_g1_i1.p1 TRINITY_DN2270_c0_g1~~TRINITY_DN2270_c0_g1_i1.p1  ORF type:complete len:263 (+),score=62.32 TRINITY_DN2270_c0_g1_i1:442-1230(+)